MVLPFRAASPVVKSDLIGVHHGMRLRPVCQSWRCGSTNVLDDPVVLRISFTPPEGSLRARCGPACEWDAAQEAPQGCDAGACTTPVKWHNARVVRGGICTTAVENDCAHCCTPTEFLETLEFQRDEEWRARSLGKVYVQLLRLPTMRALYRRICTAGGDWALIGDVGMRLVAITVREKRLCEKWEPHDMNDVPMKHDGGDTLRGVSAIIRMVRVRSASGREGLVARFGVCL